MSEEQTWRQQLKGVRAFVETLKEPEAEERDTRTIAGKFAEALGCLEDAAHWFREIDKEFERAYPDDMDPNDPAAPFWYAIGEVSESRGFSYSPLEKLQKMLETVAPFAPKEKETSKEGAK